MLRAPKICVLFALLLHLSPVRAQEVTAGRHHVVMLAAMLSLAERWCSDYRIGKDLLAGLVAEAGSSKALMQQRAIFEGEMRRMGEHAYCDRLYETFGHGGLPNDDGDAGDVPFMMKR
jgi:hypothetical protein